MTTDPLNRDSPTPEHVYVSTAQVANALGVSVTTVKRWVDDGVLPAHRTAGGHRKLLMADVLRLVREGNLPQADLSSLLPRSHQLQTDPQILLKQTLEAIRKNDLDLIRTIIHGAYQAGLSVDVIADLVIAPALSEVGEQWSTGRIDVMKEHRIMQSVISALYELRAYLRMNAESNRPVAVGGASEGDHYIVPSLLAKLTLIDNGWDAINLGPNTPMSAFMMAVTELKPQLLWLSITKLNNVDSFLTDYRKLYSFALDHQVPIVIGGRGLPDTVRSKMPYTAFGDGMIQLAAFSQSLYRRPTRPKRGRPIGSTNRSREQNETTLEDLGNLVQEQPKDQSLNRDGNHNCANGNETN